MAFDFTGYMRDVAIKLKAVGHVEGAKEKKFFRISSVVNLDELVECFANAGSPMILVEDNRTGRFMDGNNQNYLDNQSYAFLVVQHCKVSDAESREQAKNDTIGIVKKIISRMKRDRQRDQEGQYAKTGLRNFDLNSMMYQTIGPLGDNYYGTLVQFGMLEVVNKDLVYDASEWEE